MHYNTSESHRQQHNVAIVDRQLVGEHAGLIGKCGAVLDRFHAAYPARRRISLTTRREHQFSIPNHLLRIVEREHNESRLANPLSETECRQSDFRGDCTVHGVGNLAPVMVVATKDHVWLDLAQNLARERSIDHVLVLFAMRVHDQSTRFSSVAAVCCFGTMQRHMCEQDPWCKWTLYAK